MADFLIPERRNCLDSIRRENCDNNNNNGAQYFGSFYSVCPNIVAAGGDIHFVTGDVTTDGIQLDSDGNIIKILHGGYYFITYGIDASGVSPHPKVQLYKNGHPVAGTDLEIDAVNVMETVTKIVSFQACDTIELRVVSGSVALTDRCTNAYIDLFLVHEL